jgi:hypothetical protein
MNNVSRNTAPYLFPFIRPSQDNGARANLYEGTDKQPQLIQESQILWRNKRSKKIRSVAADRNLHAASRMPTMTDDILSYAYFVKGQELRTQILYKYC